MRSLVGLVSIMFFVSVASGQVTSNVANFEVSLLKSGLSGPTDVAFRPRSVRRPTHDIVVSQYGSDQVSLVNLFSGATTPFASQSKPVFIANRSSDGVVAVETDATGPITFYSPTGIELGSIAAGSPAACLTGLAFDHAGNFYVAGGVSTSSSGCPSQVSFAMSSVFEFDGPTPWTVTPSPLASGLNALEGLAFSLEGGPSGSLFAVSNADGSVYQIVLGAHPTVSTIATVPSGATTDPSGIAVDPVNGDLYISEFLNGDVVKITATGRDFIIFATGFSQPSGLGFDTGRNLFVSDFGTGDIWKFTRRGIRRQ